MFSSTTSLVVLFFAIVVSYHQSSTAFAQFSDQCEAEINELQSNSAIMAEYNVLETSLEDVNFDNFCTQSGTSLNCVIDYSEISNNIKSICEEQGGQYSEVDFNIKCRDGDVSLTVGSRDTPDCIGTSCDPSNVQNELDTAFQELERELANQGLDCSVNSDAASDLSYMFNAFIAVVGFVGFFGFAFY